LDRNSVPKEAITEEIGSPFAIHEWELETLANELLATPKRENIKHGRTRSINTVNFNTIVQATNYLRKLEDIEYGSGPDTGSVFMEMTRIANRQFDWQRGYLNIPQFYRNAFIYGQGPCAAYFASQNGITVNQLSLVGFGIYSALASRPAFGANSDLSFMGVSRDDTLNAIKLLTQPIENARFSAREKRKNIFHTAYRPSILRMKPCISFGPANLRIKAPLPQLILERVTSGIFYDVVGGGGEVRKDYGRRFEEYCLAYFRAALPDIEWLGESRYRIKPNDYDTPDILCRTNKEIALVMECKATRMSYEARFGDNALNDRGVEDLVKAVFQLWRFFSHCRRGLTPYQLGPESIGAVLTLDSWLTMANPLREKVLVTAKQLAADKDQLILEEDFRPIAFIAVSDLERTLLSASGESFLRATSAASSEKYACWHLDSVYKDIGEEILPPRPYPFSGKMGEVLPWWDLFQERKERISTMKARAGN
jgi:hypothetical protein